MESVSQDKPRTTASSTVSAPNSSADTFQRDSVAVRRLMEEVRCEETAVPSPAAYNRQHNRHNR